MNDHKNPHTELLPYAQVVYWENGSACGKLDPWTRAEVHGPRGQFPRIEFKRDQQPEMLTVLRLMEESFAQGEKAKAHEIRVALGIPSSVWG